MAGWTEPTARDKTTSKMRLNTQVNWKSLRTLRSNTGSKILKQKETFLPFRVAATLHERVVIPWSIQSIEFSRPEYWNG